MIIRKILPFLLLAFVCLCSSCSLINQGSGYDASPVFAPLHEKSGELKASAGYGSMLGAQGNISYALTNHFAFTVGGVYNHQTVKELGIMDPIYFKLKNHYLEGALGYYLPLSGKKFSNFEMFAGFGKGVVDKKNSFYKNFADESNSESYSKAQGNYFKTFLQISAEIPTKFTSSDLKFVLANRISYLYFDELSFDEIYTYQRDTNNFHKSSITVTEPVIIFNYGKKLILTGQIGVAVPLSASLKKNLETYANASGIFQIGFKYNIK